MDNNDMDATTWHFVEEHSEDDVHRLALTASKYPDVDIQAALAQIDGRQRARLKLPSWAAIEGIRYPVHLSMEQCSSEQTARYKSTVIERLMRESPSQKGMGACFVDLTGGFGVDFSFIAPQFDHAVYVERQDALCKIAKHNFDILHLGQAEVVCGDGVDFLQNMAGAGVIFLDPARRDANGGKVVAISDCTPDVIKMKDLLLEKSHYTMIKLSPMLDWHKAVEDLNAGFDCVSELHIVSVDNECKELLLVLTKEHHERAHIYCVNDSSRLTFAMLSDGSCRTMVAQLSDIQNSMSDNDTLFLYEPNASIMKAGCFSILEDLYKVKALGRNSHLFVSTQKIDDFPGRRFMVDHATTMNRKELKESLAGVEKANITVRNFNMSVSELRKRLKIKEGGDKYIFATTISDKQHVLLVCRKV